MRRGQGNFLTRDRVGVSCPCPGWDAQQHIDGSNLKYLQGKMRVLGSPFSEHTFVLAQFVAVLR